MAPINQMNAGEQDYQINVLSSWLATVGVMAAMILSLVGIKIWWFKHRLTFEQNATQNGAAGGNQPILKSYTKDKRTSQQVVDSVTAHGIFRKRDENELDTFERPKQLPPIRIPQRSQSATALMPPPRARRGGNITPEISAAQQQAPPYAIKESQSISALDQIAADQTDTNGIETTTGTQEARLFRKVALPSERKPMETQITDERRATGFMRPEETIEIDQWLKEQNVTDVTAMVEIESPPIQWAPNAEETWPSSPASEMAKFPDNEQIWQEMGVAVEAKNSTQTHFDEDFAKTRHSYQEHEGHYLELETENWPQNFEASELETAQKSPSGYGDSIDDDWPNFQQLQISEANEDATKMANFSQMPEISKLSEFSKIEETTTEFEVFSKFEQNFNFDDYAKSTADVASDKQFENFAQFSSVEPISNSNSSYDEISNMTQFSEIKQIDSIEPISNYEQLLSKAELAQFSIIEKQKTNFEQISNYEAQNQNNPKLLTSATAYVKSIEELYDDLSDNETAQTQNVENVFEESTTQATIHQPKTSILKERLQNFENADYEAPIVETRKLKSQQKVTFDFNTEEYYLPESETEEDDEEADEYDEDAAHKEKARREHAKRQTAYYGQKYQDDDEDEDDDEYGEIIEPEMPKIPPPPLPRIVALPPPQPMQRLTKLQTQQNSELNEFEEQIAEIHENSTWTTTKSMRTITKYENFKEAEEIYMEQQQQQQQQRQQQTALLFSSQILSSSHVHEMESKELSDENDSWASIQRQRRYKNEQQQQQQQQYQQFDQHEDDDAYKLKPQASPRLGGQRANAVRAPAPRHLRKPRYDEQEVGITEV